MTNAYEIKPLNMNFFQLKQTVDFIENHNSKWTKIKIHVKILLFFVV